MNRDPHNEHAPWARAARWGLAVYVVLVVVCGGAFIAVEAAAGAFATLMIGIVAIAAACLLAGLAWLGVALYEHHAASTERLERIQHRLRQISRVIAGHSVDLETFAGDDIYVIDEQQHAGTPRLAGGWSEEWADELTGLTFLPSPLPPASNAAGEPDLLGLRRQFGAYLRAERYADALSTGEQIERLAPDSRMAEDFRTLRPLLERRLRRLAAHAETQAH